MTIDEVWKKIEKEGPAYVLLDKDSAPEMLVLALKKNPELSWDLIYIRDDGWSLGCDFYLGQHAENLFRDRWVAWVRRGDKKPRPLKLGS